jgi:hypothetical protein
MVLLAYMKKRTKNIVLGAVLLLVAGALFMRYEKATSPVVACTMEAKICPDGSAVGRSGPLCEFSACPNGTSTAVASNGTLQGNVTIGPICPVEVNNKPCDPTAEMYAAAKVFVYTEDKKTLVKTITPNSKGNFSVNLPAGAYFINMTHQRIGSTNGVPVTITLIPNGTVTLKLSVDTGLR